MRMNRLNDQYERASVGMRLVNRTAPSLAGFGHISLPNHTSVTTNSVCYVCRHFAVRSMRHTGESWLINLRKQMIVVLRR